MLIGQLGEGNNSMSRAQGFRFRLRIVLPVASVPWQRPPAGGPMGIALAAAAPDSPVCLYAII